MNKGKEAIMHIASYWHGLDNGRVACDLCPHHCKIPEGKRGICRNRTNQDGTLYSEVYGHPCALAIDPIEKKPLLHFHPGSQCLSIACTGCNFRCKNCQNYEISQSLPDQVPWEESSPEDIIHIAQRYHQDQIAYTYTEPLTYFEYVRDIACLAHENGMRNILVSAGYINPEPLKELSPLLDAANIDLKSFSDTLYQEVSGGHLAPVLDTLLTLKNAGVWLEITHLLIPTVNDDMEMFRKMCQWLVGNGFKDTPLHISRFFPLYKMESLSPTPLRLMKEAERIAREEGIRWVHLGNV